MGNNNSSLKYRIFSKDNTSNNINDITDSCVLDHDCNIINEKKNEASVQCNIEDIYYVKKIKILEDTVYTLENENDKLFSDLQRYKIKIGGLLESLKPKRHRSNPFNCEDFTNTSNNDDIRINIPEINYPKINNPKINIPKINIPNITIEDEFNNTE